MLTQNGKQKQKNTQLWMCLVVKVKFNAVKNNIAQESGLFMKHGKFEVIKQEMARVNIDILGIRELTWMGLGEFNSGDHYIYYCGQEFLR